MDPKSRTCHVTLIFISLTLLLLASVSHGKANSDNHEEQFLYGFLAGTYWLVGKALDSDHTYFGTVEFIDKGGYLEVIRNIEDQEQIGTGKIKTAPFTDTNTLHITFEGDSLDYEVSYLISGDLDNYARLTGHVFRPGEHTESPGLEALFINTQ